MRKRIARCIVVIGLVGAFGGRTSSAQDASQENATIDAIRQLAKIEPGDQRRIGDWVQAKVDALAKTPPAERPAAVIKFRSGFKAQYENPSNSAAFKQQFPAQTAATALTQFGNEKLDVEVARALGRVLLDMVGAETVPAMLAGLKSKDAAARYLCAEGLASQRTAIAADKDSLDRTIKAVREAALSETSPVVLSRLYLALSVPPNQLGAVFDAFAAILNKRLESRRGGAVMADGAEIEAYEYFRTPAVLNALNPQQKEQLVRLIAVFLRMDARRYDTPDLTFDEKDKLERMLDAVEEILTTIVGPNKGGNLRDLLAGSGHERRGDAPNQAALWVGNAESSQQGALNAAPWNVPVGAP